MGVNMVIKDLERFNDEGLDVIQKLLCTETTENLILEIERIKYEREMRKTKTLNDMFSVDYLNIDKDLIERLKKHGIHNMTQLLAVDLDEISSANSESRNQYEYARQMFDFRPQEELARELGRPLTYKEAADSIIKQVKVKKK